MPTKKIKNLKTLKDKLKKYLPQKISEVITSYENFSEKQAPDDAKGFSAHHSACKAAVVHAETLLKLARWTEDENLETSASTKQEDWLVDWLNEAKHEEEDDAEN